MTTKTRWMGLGPGQEPAPLNAQIGNGDYIPTPQLDRTRSGSPDRTVDRPLNSTELLVFIAERMDYLPHVVPSGLVVWERERGGSGWLYAQIRKWQASHTK